MNQLIWKPLLILAVLAGCLLLLYPPSERLRPGLDLAGGTTLIYDVRVPQGADASRTIDDLINVLRDRVDPAGTRNLVWRQVAGNRIEIQMALATPAAKQRRQVFEEARDALFAGNLTPGEINRALESPERDARLSDLARGDEQTIQSLRLLAEAHDEFTAISEPYQANNRALREAERALATAGPEMDEAQREQLQQQVAELRQRTIDQAQAFLEARARRESALSDVLARNIEPTELARALDAPVQGTRRRPARADLVQQLRDRYPTRGAEIDRVLEAFVAYDQVRGPLDDPNDLITLLRGSGVLEFRIAPPVDMADQAAYRERLRERGPRAGTDLPYRWFVVDDIDQFIDDRRQEQLLIDNPAVFFAQHHRLIGDAHADGFYVLLGNTPDRAMTRDQNWQLRSATRGQDQLGRNAVNFNLDAPGGDLMGAITGANVGRQMAILLDNRVISAPRLQGQIRGQGQITGSFSERDLNYLLRTIKAGSSEAELSEYPISIKTTGPQIGADNLRRGMTAAVLSLILVGAFMASYYLVLGAFANFALLANMIIILGVMALFGATFTLPGIAGIVLTIGMSVDANVLIFERIREELDRKAELATAVRLGFQKALSSIVDANVTTFITCVVLFYTATAEIRGFAITLMIGILATLFTALFCTRVLIELYSRLLKPRTLHMLPSLIPAIGRVLTPNIDWLSKRYYFFGITAVLLTIGVSMIAIRGVDMLDIEFRSGTAVSFTLDDGRMKPIGEVRERLRKVGQMASAVQAGQDPATVAGVTADDLAMWRSDVEQLVRTTMERFRREAADPATPEPAEPNFGHLVTASVVSEGAMEGTAANGFSIATLMTDAQAVSDAVKVAMKDVLATTRPIEFRDINETIGTTDSVFAITTADLGEVINRGDVTANVPDFLGGVAIVIEQMQPAATIDELRERIRRIRMQPAHEGLGFRQFDVIGLEPSEVGPAGERLYRDAVIVVHDAGLTSYIDTPDALREADGLAATEWALIRDALQQDTSLASVSNFSSQVSATMRQEAAAALGLSLLAVVAYIWFRFGSLRYSIGAIAALVHDVLMVLGMVALSGWLYDNEIGHLLLLDPFMINLAMIAALLTIVGYSLNDTIIIFDRIRENRGRLSYATPQIINDSINQTISRTVITSGTTLMALLVLYIFGGPGVHGFAFAMLIGILVGTYSSIAVAAPIVMIGARMAAERAAQQRSGAGVTPQPAT